MSGRNVFFERDSGTTIIIMKVQSGKVYVERNSDGNFISKIPNQPKTSNVDIRDAVRLLENRGLAADMRRGFSTEGLTLKSAKRIFPKFRFNPSNDKSSRNPAAGGAFHKMDVNP